MNETIGFIYIRKDRKKPPTPFFDAFKCLSERERLSERMMIIAFFAGMRMYSRITSYPHIFTVFNIVWLNYANVELNEQIKRKSHLCFGQCNSMCEVSKAMFYLKVGL